MMFRFPRWDMLISLEGKTIPRSFLCKRYSADILSIKTPLIHLRKLTWKSQNHPQLKRKIKSSSHNLQKTVGFFQRCFFSSIKSSSSVDSEVSFQIRTGLKRLMWIHGSFRWTWSESFDDLDLGGICCSAQKTNGGFLKRWYPLIIHFSRVFHYKPSILGYPYCLETPKWGGYSTKNMPLYGSKDPLLGKKLRVQFGGVKYLLRRENLDTKNMNNASIFFAGWNNKNGRVQYVFSWVESTMCASHWKPMTMLFCFFLCCGCCSFGGLVTHFFNLYQFIEYTVYYTYIHCDIQFMVNLMPRQITDSATNHLQTFWPASSLQRKGFTVVVDPQSSPHVGRVIY